MASLREILARTQNNAPEQKKKSVADSPRSVCVTPSDFASSRRGNATGANSTTSRSNTAGRSIPLSSLGRIPTASPDTGNTHGGTDTALHLCTERNTGNRVDRREATRRETCPPCLPAENLPDGTTVNLTWIPFSQTSHPNTNYEQQKQKTYITFHGFVEETRQPCYCFNTWRPQQISIDALGRQQTTEWRWQTDGVILYAELRLPY